MPRSRALPASILFLLLVFTRTSAADPITLTSGVVRIGAPRGVVLDSLSFEVFGESGFRATGLSPEDAFAGGVRCNIFVPCGPGNTIAGPTTVSFQGLGSATIGGTAFGTFVDGGFSFQSSPVTIPTGPFDLALRSPFAATGRLTIDNFTNEGRVPGTSVTLQGQGTVTTHFRPIGEGFAVSGFSYEFAAASPTPEPGTLLLLASGSIIAIRRARRAGRMRCAPTP